MFCPACGFEYTQKTNYCKRCGEDLSPTATADAPKTTLPNVTGMLRGILAFCFVSMLVLLIAYNYFQRQPWPEYERFGPVIAGGSFVTVVVLLLIWQLARMITVVRRTGQNVIVERHFIRESPPVQFVAPTEQIPRAVNPQSVVESTTRQYADLYESPKEEEKTGTR